MSEMPKYLTDTGRDNDALNSAVGVLLTKQAMPHASTQSILWDAIKDYAERAEERSPSHASLVEENKRMRAKLDTIEALIGNVDHSRGGGENAARMYGEMLNDIRDIAGDTNA